MTLKGFDLSPLSKVIMFGRRWALAMMSMGRGRVLGLDTHASVLLMQKPSESLFFPSDFKFDRCDPSCW